MPISEMTRKRLWGCSGNRCAICKRELIEGIPDKSGIYARPSVIGDECHIISRKSNGPRHDPNYPENQLDSFENIILLCRVDHKNIDDQFKFYTADKLRKIKSKHEASVSQTLSGTSRIRSSLNKESNRVILRSGRDVLSFIDPAHAVSFNNEELNSEKETDVVAKFFKEVHDWDDYEEVAGPAERVKLEYELSKLLDELKRFGLLVFGERKYRTYEFDLGQVELLVSSLIVVKERD